MQENNHEYSNKVILSSAKSPYNSYNFLSNITAISPKFFTLLNSNPNYSLYRHNHNKKILVKCYGFDLLNTSNSLYFINVSIAVHDYIKRANFRFSPRYVIINVRPYNEDLHSKMSTCNFSIYSFPEWTSFYNFKDTISVIVFRPYLKNIEHPNTQVFHIFNTAKGIESDPNDSSVDKDTFKTEFLTKINMSFCKNFKFYKFSSDIFIYRHIYNSNITLHSHIGEIINSHYINDDLLMSISLKPTSFYLNNVNSNKKGSKKSIFEKVTLTLKPYSSLIKGNNLIEIPYRKINVHNKSFSINIIDKDTYHKPDYVLCSYPPRGFTKNPPAQIISLSKPMNSEVIDKINYTEDNASKNTNDPENIDEYYSPSQDLVAI